MIRIVKRVIRPSNDRASVLGREHFIGCSAGLLTLLACQNVPLTTGAPTPSAVVDSKDTIPLAFTIDDLPFAGPTAEGDDSAAAVGRLIDGLLARKIPATGFVVCSRAETQAAAWARWRSSGYPLGNHSYDHRSLNRVPAQTWLDDVARCQSKLTSWLGTAPRWFRYPFLQTGTSTAVRARAFEGLQAIGLERAPISVDTSDWLLAKAYAAARGTQRGAAIGEAYVEHIRQSWRHYRAVARARVGREVPQVLLVHANALLADQLPHVLDALEAEGARFVSLKDALSDPIYAANDDWIDPVGASWLYRVTPADKKAWAWDQGQQRALAARFLGRAEDKPYRIGPATTVRRLEGYPAWVVRHEKPVAANALVYVTAEGIPVLVDTPWTSAATRNVLDWAKARFGRPVELTVVGHYHADSAGGVGALRAAGVSTLGSAQTARLITERGAALQKSLIKTYGPAFAGPLPVPPARTFVDQTTLSVGGTTIRVFYPGPAHSPDNVVTYFPETGVLFGGCMVKAGASLGYLGDADLGGWPSAIQKLMAVSPKVVIPGHGDRVDPGLLQHTLDLLKARSTER